ncbi:MAG: putative rane protein [Gaiellales bacterium]|nr:putative rane protein [Gaiellales bacterium]
MIVEATEANSYQVAIRASFAGVKRAVWTWAGNAIALYAAVASVGHASFAGWTSLLLAAAVFGVVNAVVKPVVTLLALPLILLTVGIALFFINVLMLWITDKIVAGIHFDGFVSLVTASVVIWLVNMVLTWLPGPWRESRKR